MSIYENPSAGKFESPSPPPEPAAERPFSPRLLTFLIVVLLGVGAYWLRTAFPGAWASLISLVVAFGFGLFDLFMISKDRAEKDPYSTPTNITR
jgi:uncharacterized RDD family membrane protein YckC